MNTQDNFDTGAILADLESFYTEDSNIGGGVATLDLEDQAQGLVLLWELAGHIRMLYDRNENKSRSVRMAYPMARGLILNMIGLPDGDTTGDDVRQERARAIVDAMPFGVHLQAILYHTDGVFYTERDYRAKYGTKGGES